MLVVLLVAGLSEVFQDDDEDADDYGDNKRK
jgi:hypothetical protein